MLKHYQRKNAIFLLVSRFHLASGDDFRCHSAFSFPLKPCQVENEPNFHIPAVVSQFFAFFWLSFHSATDTSSAHTLSALFFLPSFSSSPCVCCLTGKYTHTHPLTRTPRSQSVSLSPTQQQQQVTTHRQKCKKKRFSKIFPNDTSSADGCR